MTQRQAEKGQILLPALAAYLGLLLLFFAMVVFGMRTLMRMRLEMAAQAAALSAARATAQALNGFATHNLLINGYVPLSYQGKGAMYVQFRDAFKFWLKAERSWRPWKMHLASHSGQCVSVGREVALLNGADPGKLYFPLFNEFHLEAMPMGVALLQWPFVPAGFAEFEDAYYTREWGLDQRKAQPDHIISWLAAKGRMTAVGCARVYLDLQHGASMHNGGFPRMNEELWSWGNVEMQSFLPQFNARLRIPPLGHKVLLEKMHRMTVG